MKRERSSVCNDCNLKPVTVFYGIGERCDECAEVFNQKLFLQRQAEHEAEVARKDAHVCGEDDEVCSECCSHEYDMSEGGYCINGCEKHFMD